MNTIQSGDSHPDPGEVPEPAGVRFRRVSRKSAWKNLGFFLPLLLMVPSSTQACDFCNCVMGINPFYTSMNRIGVTTLFQNSRSAGTVPQAGDPGSKFNPAYGKLYHGVDVVDSAGVPVTQTEQRLTFEFSYRHHLSEHVIVTGLLPFTFSRTEAVGSLSVRGLGDATVLGHYILGDLFSERTSSTLLIGGGLELPTGNNGLRDDDGHLLDPRFQLGSGTVDLIGNVLLTVPVDKWNLALDVYGKLNNENGRGNRLGHSLALTASASRELYRNNPANVALIGVGGVREELAGKDLIAGELDASSGSSVLWGNIGAQLVVGSLKVNATALVPFAQQRDEGGADERVRFSVGAGFEFN